jgi:hypothetical protein
MHAMHEVTASGCVAVQPLHHLHESGSSGNIPRVDLQSMQEAPLLPCAKSDLVRRMHGRRVNLRVTMC